MKVSIIVPVFNACPYFAETLRAIREQTFTDWECILVDDGSHDGSPNLCRIIVKEDARFRFIALGGGGVSAARNAALDVARGEYIAFCDSDDLPHPEYLARLVAARETTQADVAYVDEVRFGQEAPPSYELADEPAYVIENPIDEYAAFRLDFALWHSLYRAEAIRGLRLPKGIGCGEDRVFGYQVLKRSLKFVKLPGCLYAYRQRMESIVHSGMSRAKMAWFVEVLRLGEELWRGDDRFEPLRKAETVMMVKQMARLAGVDAAPALRDLRRLGILRYRDFSFSWRWRLFKTLLRGSEK